MARKKKSMIGFDPLGWLSDDGENSQAETPEENNASEEGESKPANVKKTIKNKEVSLKKTSEKTPKKVSKAKVSKEEVSKVKAEKPLKAKVKMIQVLGHTLDENLLTVSYELIGDSMEEIVTEFYKELFLQHPAVIPLFENTDEAGRASKLSAALRLLYENIHNETILKSVLADLGERHQGYGAEEAHYGAVASVLVDAFKQHLGDQWTTQMSAVWLGLLTAAAGTMLAAYKEIEVTDMQTDKDTNAAKDVLVLLATQDISQSDALKNTIVDMVKSQQHIHIDASAVQRVDGSALQLLCSLFEYAKTHEIELSWTNPSEAMLTSAEYLGVKQRLNLN